MKRIGRKAFIISNIVIAILLIAIINIPTIIGLFGQDEELTEINIGVLSDYPYPITSDLSLILNEGIEGKDYFITEDIDTFDEDSFWLESDLEIVLEFVGSSEAPSVLIYSKESSYNQMILSIVELQLIRYEFENYVPLTYDFPQAPDYEDPEAGMMISSLSTIFILPLFLLITMATQFVGVEIIEEKSTKAIETIIASVPAQIHFLSKIASAISFVIIQGGLIMFYSLIGSLIGGASAQSGLPLGMDGQTLLAYVVEVLPNWRGVLLVAVLFVFIGTLFYLVIAALFASMAVTQEDYQQFQSPLMFMLLGGFYIAIFAPMANGDGFLKIMSFVPFFSPIVAPVAYASGSITTLEAMIGLSITFLSLIALLYIASPVYRVAILSYDQTKFMKRIKSYFKKGFVNKKRLNN
ncbi:MAG: ABC transporter permease, partial [Acholeplasmataceae bacterium]